MVTTTAATSATSQASLDVNGIVTQLMTVERQPITKLNAQEASYQAKLSAFGTLSSAVSTFQTSLQGLNSASQFQALKATPSDATIFSATTASTAVAGSYTLDVTSLAQAQRLAAAGQTSSTAAIGTGAATTLTFDFGTISGNTLNTTTGKYGTALSASITNGSTTVTVASTANLAVGASISGTGIPAGATIASITDATNFVISAAATATGAGVALQAGATFTSNGSGLKTVSLNGTNNSLQGIRDAINAAGIGVTAAIINDGSATPYRLTLTSNNMGVSNSMSVSVSGDAAISNLLTNNPGTVAAVAGTTAAANGSTIVGAVPGTTAGTIAAGTLIATTSAGAISIGSITLGADAVVNGTNIRDAINTALAAAPGGAAVNGSATVDATGFVTITSGTSAIALSMGGYAADPATATANQATLMAQTGFSAAQLGSQQALGSQKMSQSAMGQDAVFNVNGVAVTKTSNSVSDVIQGVTLNLLKTTTSTATLTVARDTAATTTAINSFVKAYNDLAKFIADSTAYNATTKKGAVFQGDATVRGLQAQLRNMLSASVVGTSGVLTTLPQIGITFQKDGSLLVDSAKLSTAMTNYPNDIASLFASVGKATDSLVSFNNATTATKAGNYAVNITQLATVGSITGNAVPTGTIASGTAITVALDGVSASVALTAGTYTAAQLATMIQSAINGTSAFSAAGSSVAATINGSGFLNISSNRYGSSSAVSMVDGTGTTVSAIMGAAPTSSSGVDIAGTIGGTTGAGYGQVLSAVNGDPQGLSIVVSGGATGARGTLNYSQGYATTLSTWSTSVLASGGSITARTDGINKTILDIGKRRDALNQRLIGVEARYRAQFTRLDAMLNSMNTTSTFLTQQLARL